MILYNVTVSVEDGVADEWLEWMRAHHLPEVMATGYFVSHRLSRMIQPAPEPGTTTFAVQYYCTSQEKLTHYLERCAPRLREEHNRRYGHRAQAFRTVLEILHPDTEDGGAVN